MNFSRFVQMRLQGAPIDAPIANDLGGGGGGTVQTNTIQNSDPWSGVQPYLNDIFDRGNNLFQRGYYTGPQLGVQSEATQRSLDLAQNRAYNGSPLTRAAQGQNLATVRGDYLDLSKNPAAKSAMDMARTQINSQFSGDNYGNSAHQEWLGKGLITAAAPFYQQERAFQQQATAQAPALAEQDYADISKLASVGAARDARYQADVDAQKAAWNAPWESLFNYQRAIAGSGATGGTTSSSGQQPYFSNPLGNALGLGIGGLGLYNGLTQAGLLGSAAAGASAMGAGALGGGLAASAAPAGWGGMFAFSDRRLKKDIKRIGNHRLGFGIYEYTMRGIRQIGVMADEVAKVIPEAVKDVCGLKMVNYGAL